MDLVSVDADRRRPTFPCVRSGQLLIRGFLIILFAACSGLLNADELQLKNGFALQGQVKQIPGLTTATIQSEREGWLQVTLPNGLTGWVVRDAAERI